MNYRPLFPKVDPDGDATEQTDGAQAKVSRRKLTTIACVHCRLKKTKCDGERPSCKRCQAKDIECTYPDDGDAHIRASRLASYECLLGTLRHGTEADAESMIHRLRHPIGSADDSATKQKLKSIHDFIKRLQEVPDEEAVSLVTRLRSGEALHDVFRDARGVTDGGESHRRASAEETEDGASPMDSNHFVGREHHTSHLDSQPVVESEESNQLEDILYSWNRMSVSDTTRIRTAVDAFFEFSERWFLVFAKDTIMDYHHDVYVESSDRSQAMKQAELCCLCAVAAMGLRYANTDDEYAREYAETLYHTSTNYFAILYKILPLDAIKVCTLLANFNIKSKRTTALAFIEIGLSLCMKHNLHDHNIREPGMSEDTWLNHRKTWRTLLFQSLLLSSALGYVSGGGLFFEEFTVSEVELETVPMLQITVSRELTKLCILKANISRMDFTLKGQPGASPGSLMQDMQEWYRQLPNDLYLGALIDEQSMEKRVAIYYVNLMFLSATGLLYRHTAGRFLRSVGFVTRDAAFEHSASSKYVFDNATEGILAAQQSARIFEFLVLEDVAIWKCWLVILQAYTTCTILMQSVLQQQIHGDSIENWSRNMQHAQSCLAILERCGSADSTVTQMHNQLASIFRRAADFDPSKTPSVPAPLVAIPPGYLLTIPQGIEGNDTLSERLQLSTSLLVRLCGPFGNVGEHGMLESGGSPA
ncbi:hypothetical protein PG993_007087 [Apiospora rasikravindrae]|uniref:Zn(2)-C6 fungal-type domain-containing protein n=1 Tax=Apiospora rasikravindrae TaxID=990691 RepID=A0ABR1SXW9_9PEZI